MDADEIEAAFRALAYLPEFEPRRSLPRPEYEPPYSPMAFSWSGVLMSALGHERTSSYSFSGLPGAILKDMPQSPSGRTHR